MHLPAHDEYASLQLVQERLGICVRFESSVTVKGQSYTWSLQEHYRRTANEGGREKGPGFQFRI